MPCAPVAPVAPVAPFNWVTTPAGNVPTLERSLAALAASAVSVSFNYDAYYLAADEIGGAEYHRNYRNCNCGAFNCRTNCNCNCDCNCACCD